MSSIQERLQMKRSPIDTWNIREQLCLASAVVRSGDQNWMSVSRALKTVGEPNRPGDWYSQKSCAAQYGVLLENVETPKRKKRNSEGAVETPQESILKKLTQERIVEIQKTLAEMSQQYEQIKAEVIETRNPSSSEDRLRELWSGIEANKRAREREAARRAAWLREREDRRARAERAWRPQLAPAAAGQSSPAPSPAPPSSPLLTSLLKSSPVVTTPQHISHPANVIETVSPSAGAPTLSMLLEKPGGHEPNADAAIEHIKSQLVQIEQQLKAGGPTALAAHAHAPALDIDDIEIKAEDVYAFRDIDIVIPPVAAMHKTSPRAIEKPVFKRETETPSVSLCEPPSETMATQEAKDESPEPVPAQELPPSPEVTNPPQTTVETEAPPLPAEEPTPEPEVKVSYPEVKVSYPEVRFPTTEIRVIQSDEQKIKSVDRQTVHPTVKEEVKEPEAPAPEPTTVPEPPVVPKLETVPETELEPVVVTEPKAVVVPEETTVSKESEPEVPTEAEPSTEDGPQQQSSPVAVEAAEPCGEELQLAPPLPQDIPLPPEPPRAAADSDVSDVTPADTGLSPDPPLPSEPEVVPLPEEDIVEEGIKAEEIPLPPLEAEACAEPEMGTKAEADANGDETQKVADEVSKEEDAEDSMPLKDIIAKETTSAEVVQADAKAEPDEKTEAETEAEAKPPLEEGHNETDDDTPMELSREEEKDGKTKRDYSRKKKPDSRTCSGSESAEASAPESPGGCDAERQHRLWKRSVLLVYSRLCAHKYASLFQRPISDEEAPGYSAVVRRPMDLGTIKRNIDSGAVRTTAEFQRDVMLMLSNALLYNSSEHSVYQMARELHEEAQGQLGMLLAAQAHAGLQAPPPGLPAANTRKRRRHAEPRHHHKRPRH